MLWKIDRDSNTRLLWRSHHVMTLYNHYIIQIPTKCDTENSHNGFRIVPVEWSNIDDCSGGDFSVVGLKKEMQKNRNLVEGFLCYDGNTRLGYIWIMYRGGNESQYRVRRAEAFIFDLFVFPEARRRGVASALLYYSLNRLYNKGISKATLACRKNNTPALKLYYQNKGIVVAKKRWIRIWKVKIPYCSV